MLFICNIEGFKNVLDKVLCKPSSLQPSSTSVQWKINVAYCTTHIFKCVWKHWRTLFNLIATQLLSLSFDVYLNCSSCFLPVKLEMIS